MADCNGPACGEVGQRLDTFGVVVLIVILALFVLVMTVGARFVRPDRRPTD
jgi:hypothetical protein